MRAFLHRHRLRLFVFGIWPAILLLLCLWGYSRADVRTPLKSWQTETRGYVFSPEIEAQLPPNEALFLQWLAEGSPNWIVQDYELPFFLNIDCTPAEHQKLEAWLTEQLGARKWFLFYEPTFNLRRTFKGRTYGITGWHVNHFIWSGKLEHRGYSVLTYEAWRNIDIINHAPDFVLSTTRLQFRGPPWLLVLGLFYLPLLFLYFLRRPVLRALRLRRARH